jgi:LysM repeat protein
MNMIRRMPAFALALGLVTATARSAGAGIDNAGTTAANFLSVGSGAGVLGMGGASLAIGGDLQRAAWNVAGLAAVDATQFTFSHASLAEQNNQEWFGAGGRLGRGATHWGIHALYQGDGSFDGRDALGNPTGDFSASSTAFGASLAHRVAPGVAVGVGVKYASESLADVRGSGLAFDLGLMGRQGPFGFGVAAQNAFGNMRYDGAAYPFPANYGAGVSVDVPGRGITLALDVNAPEAYYTDARLGVEWRHHDVLALRTGYRMEMGADEGEPLTGPTFGMGAGVNGFWFDYGYVLGGGGTSAQHRLGLTFRPGFVNGLGMGGSPAPASRDDRSSLAPAAPKAAKPSKPAKAESPAPEKQPAQPMPGKAKPAATADPTAGEAKAAGKPGQVVSPSSSVPVPAPKPAAVVPSVPVPASKPEPAKPEPPTGRVEPAKAEAAPPPPKVEPAKPEPTPAPAAKAEPALIEAPAKAAPEPAKAEAPEKDETPVKVEAPVRTEPAKVATPATPRPKSITLRKGETLEQVAERWGVTAAAIMMENNLTTQKVKPGMKLKLPPARP